MREKRKKKKRKDESVKRERGKQSFLIAPFPFPLALYFPTRCEREKKTPLSMGDFWGDEEGKREKFRKDVYHIPLLASCQKASQRPVIQWKCGEKRKDKG